MIDSRLETFLTLIRLKNYTKTAARLNMTQPAVTQHIKYLEDYYEASLFYRRGRELILTPKGRELQEVAQKLTGLTQEAELILRSQRVRYPRYHIGTTLTVGDYIAADLVAGYLKAVPEVKISLVVKNTREILKMLRAEELDLALVEGAFNREKYGHRLLRRDELMAVCHPENPLAERDKIDLRTLIGERLILREEGSGTRKRFEAELYLRGIPLEDIDYLEAGSINLIKSMVRMDLGVSVISKTAVSEEVAKGELVQIPLEDLDLSREYNFVWMKESFKREFIEEFIAISLGRK